MKIYRNQQLKRANKKTILFDAGYTTTNTKKPIVVFAHGLKGYKDWGHFPLIMHYFIEHNFMFLKFNFSHNGGTIKNPIDFPDLVSFGNNNLSIEIEDLNDVINNIYENKIFPPEETNLDQLYVIGHSRGGGVSLLTTQFNSKIKKIVTWSSVSDFYKRLPSNIEEWKEKGVIFIENIRTKQKMPMYYQYVEDLIKNRELLTIKNAVQKIKIPQLIIHGTNDSSVLIEDAFLLKKWNTGSTLYIVENADHTYGGKHPYGDHKLTKHTLEVVNKTIEFLKK